MEKRSAPKWSQVKAKLAGCERAELISLIQDLYRANKDNQMFLHTRFGLGAGGLAPYKEIIRRWLWPDIFSKQQDTSVSKARQAISAYRNATGEPRGLAELTVFYCEMAAGYSSDVGYDDEPYLNALVRMFEEALKTLLTLPPDVSEPFFERLDAVRLLSHNIGYGVHDALDSLSARYLARRRLRTKGRSGDAA